MQKAKAGSLGLVWFRSLPAVYVARHGTRCAVATLYQRGILEHERSNFVHFYVARVLRNTLIDDLNNEISDVCRCRLAGMIAFGFFGV